MHHHHCRSWGGFPPSTPFSVKIPWKDTCPPPLVRARSAHTRAERVKASKARQLFRRFLTRETIQLGMLGRQRMSDWTDKASTSRQTKICHETRRKCTDASSAPHPTHFTPHCTNRGDVAKRDGTYARPLRKSRRRIGCKKNCSGLQCMETRLPK